MTNHKRPSAGTLADIRAARSEKKRLAGMLDQLKKDADALFSDMLTVSRPCSTCRGAKVSPKRRTPCRTCHGTGIKPLSKRARKNIDLVLKALHSLTPAGCKEASTKEIFRALCPSPALGEDRGEGLTLSGLGRVLVYLERDGLVSKRRMGPEALWSIRSLPSVLCASTKKSGGTK